jgi:Helix-turn-helix of DDE superfamily endonuclease
LTLDEFQQLVPPFETAFHTRMVAWRLDGKPRTARRFTVYRICPLPTPEDRLLFILVYLKTYALQVVHGRLFGMVQGKANQCTLSAAMGYTTQNLTSPAGRRRQR